MTEDRSILTRRAAAPDVTMAYGDDPDQLIDFRWGRDGQNRPLIFLIHGGFWKPAYDRTHSEAMSCALAGAGWTVATVEYRRIPGQPEASLNDIQAAIVQLLAQIEAHNGQVILVGHSAGGHLALWLARQKSSLVHGVLALAPVADLHLSYVLNLGDGVVEKFLGGAPVPDSEHDPKRSCYAISNVAIVHGTDDQIVPVAVAHSYCNSFPDTRLVCLPDTGHFALIDPVSTAWSSVLAEIQRLTTGPRLVKSDARLSKVDE